MTRKNDWIVITEPIPPELCDEIACRGKCGEVWSKWYSTETLSGVGPTMPHRVRFKDGWIKLTTRLPERVQPYFRVTYTIGDFDGADPATLASLPASDPSLSWDFDRYDYWAKFVPSGTPKDEPGAGGIEETDGDFAIRLARTYSTHILHLLTPQDAFRLGGLVANGR